MLSFLRGLFAGQSSPARAAESGQRPAAPSTVDGPEGLVDFLALLERKGAFPVVDWSGAMNIVDRCADSATAARVWTAFERAWLLHLRDGFGPHFHLHESEHAFVLSSLDDKLAATTLVFMERTLVKVSNALEGIAQQSLMGKDILLVVDDEDSYYSYISQYYPEDGEFASSAGMHINQGCGHFIVVKNDLRLIEPTIAHEMTHSSVSHLPLPLWLDEGIAVNTELRITGPIPREFTPAEMRQKHLDFWGREEIRQFWTGESFQRPDEGNLLSYDLARILVSHLAQDWDSFTRFVLVAHAQDGGQAAAQSILGRDLGEMACGFLGIPHDSGFSPVAA